jgi:hypothetical protein
MPYKVVAVPNGFKVKKDQSGRPVYMSNKPLTKAQAEKQKTAIILSELRKAKKLPIRK